MIFGELLFAVAAYTEGKYDAFFIDLCFAMFFLMILILQFKLHKSSSRTRDEFKSLIEDLQRVEKFGKSPLMREEGQSIIFDFYFPSPELLKKYRF